MNETEMDRTDFELSIMHLELHEPKIMERMRNGTFTKIEAGFILCGIANCVIDRDNDPEGFVKRMTRISILVDAIWELEK